MNRPVAAIVLAAGEGRRFGQPKALAMMDGKSFLQIAVEAIRDAGFDFIGIVLGAESEGIGSHPAVLQMITDCSQKGIRLALEMNPDWRSGRTGSIISGLGTMPTWAMGALLHQVDFPYVASATFRSLSDAFDRAPEATERILVPVQDGRRGHPIVIGRFFWPMIRSMGPDDPLRNLIHSDLARVVEVPILDPGIHRNVNWNEGIAT